MKLIGSKNWRQLLAAERGDTLIEVIIATVIIGMVLFSAYGLSSSAFKLGQSAKERSQATQLLQEQAEGIRSMRDHIPWDEFVSELSSVNIGEFYIDKSTGVWRPVSGRLNPSTLDSAIPNLYTVWISEGQWDPPGSADPEKFSAQINIEWNRLGGGTTQETSIAYIRLTDTNIPIASITPPAPPPPPPPDNVYVVEATSDNFLLDFYINDQPVNFTEGDTNNWTLVSKGEVTIDGGINEIAIKAENFCGGGGCDDRAYETNPAMVIWTIYKKSTGTVVARSGGINFRTWAQKSDNSNPSGWPTSPSGTGGWGNARLSCPFTHPTWNWAFTNPEPDTFTDTAARYEWPRLGMANNPGEGFSPPANGCTYVGSGGDGGGSARYNTAYFYWQTGF